jgi:GNAT superfamily N-acetyltransferase
MRPVPEAGLLGRLARAVIANASTDRETASAGPFVALVDRVSASPWASLAVPAPGAPAGTDWEAELPALEAHFSARSRALRFEFLEDLFPTLGPALERAGWPLVSRDPLFACSPPELVPAAPVPGLSLEPLDAGSPDGLVDLFLGVQHGSFEPGKTRESSAGEREQLRSRIRLGVLRCILARLDGVPAGAGSTLPAAGVAEVAGIGTLPRFRARGIGSSVTARLAADLFATGTETAWLTAGSVLAARIYQRLGFRPLEAFQRNHGR